LTASSITSLDQGNPSQVITTKGTALLKQEACIYPCYKGIAVAKISKLCAG